MEINENNDVHGRISRILDALLEISEAKVVLQNNIVEDSNRIDSLLSVIEKNTSELHGLIVGRRDKDTSKDSGNTSLTEVCFDLNKLGSEPEEYMAFSVSVLARKRSKGV